MIFDRYAQTGSPNWAGNDSYTIYMAIGAGVSYDGTITSMDNDGFTIAWVKTGAAAGTISVFYLAFR